MIGQCLPELVNKVKGLDAYAAADTEQNVIELLLIIRGYCCRFGNNQQSTWALEQAKHRVSTFFQSYSMSNADYMEQFEAMVGVVETYGGAYGHEPGLVRTQLLEQGVDAAHLDNPDPGELELANAVCREQYLSCMFLRGADHTRYHTLKNDLSNDMTKGTDNFPKTLVEAIRMLND